VTARQAIAAACVAALLLGACSDDDSSTPATSTSAAAASTTTAPTTTGDAVPTSTTPPTTETTVPLDDIRVQLQTIAEAEAPIAMTTRAGTSTVYIAERAGRVRALDVSTGTLSDPLVDISDDVSTNGERGLLGLAFSSDGGRLYLSYTNNDGDSRLDELTVTGDTVDLASRRTLLGVDQPASNHNGGDVHFGPDGMLWYGLGDGGGSGDPFQNAQNTDTLLGSILRIDVNGRTAGEYSIPADNPFVNGGGRPEIWLFGVRNPWRFSFDRATGDLWIGDVGQNAVEEVDLLPAPDRGRGANLQWPLREGFREFRGAAPGGSVEPVHDYGRGDGSCSITGGYVYRGAAVPALRGVYVFGDYCEGTVRALRVSLAGTDAVKLDAAADDLVSFGEDSTGELYTLGLDGRIARIVPA
jgi:glucose/arabinose dehydrogenase